jgi:ectoine hydroxylase-related dioxygenase (phytanoyl-CoA dioxygenase family)
MPAVTVSQADRDQFDRVGAVVVRGLVDGADLEHLSRVADALRTEVGDQGGGSCFDTRVWQRSAVVREFVRDSAVAPTAAAFIGADEIRLYEDLFIYRDAGTEVPTPWHQDEVQWPLTGTQMCSVWLSTQGASPETGALRFVAGSHRGPTYTPRMPAGREELAESFEGGDVPDVDAHPDQFPVVTFVVKPGDALVFHPKLLHGAFGSSSDHPRRTFSFRCMGSDVRWKRKRCVFLDFLRELPLNDGDPLRTSISRSCGHASSAMSLK